MDIGYLRAFEDAQKKRLAAGEVNPTQRSAADVDTRESIAMKASKAPEGGGVADGAMSGAMTGASMGGPWGAVAGAALGGLSAASQQKKKDYAAKKAGMSEALGTYLKIIDRGLSRDGRN